MRGKYLGCQRDEGANKETGELWESHELSLLVDDKAVTVRVSKDVYEATRSVPILADVEVGFGLAKGRFGRHYPVVEAVKAAARA
jgi:hypothetical protein